ETVREDRDWLQNPTTLSGDLEQNDSGKNANGIVGSPSTTSLIGNNAYQVVTADGVDDTAVLDGFIVTGGKANAGYVFPCGADCGGGINLNVSSPLLRNLTIAGNFANTHGAAIAAIDSTIELEDCVIQANFSVNSGGGIYLRKSGGVIRDVLFSGNRSTNKGGALYMLQVTDPLALTNITVNGNRAAQYGGGLYNAQSTVSLVNSIIWNNQASFEPEIRNETGTTTIAYSTIKNAYPSGVWDSTLGIDGGNNSSSNPLFVTDLAPTSAPTLSGNQYLQPLSPAADAGNSSANNTNADAGNGGRIKGAAIDRGALESGFVAELAVGKSVTPAAIEYGETITYTIVLTNSGNAYAYNTTVTDTLPADVAFLNWVQQPSGAAYQSGSHQISWVGTVVAAQSQTFTFVGRHTGGPDEVVTNSVTYGHATGSDSAEVAFTVLPLPTVDIADVTVDEASAGATLTVALSTTTRKPVVVTYATTSGSALANADFTDTTATLTITPGSLTGFLTIPVNNDFIDEEAESFIVTLTGATDGTLGDATATATILDDDTAGTNVAGQSLTVSEPNHTAFFTITFDSQPVAN
ncbi:MAG: DUF11 domain-containing protein, partial [Caldilineaceae bacterium]|nr:DUF11 domain-containing protein [Caldilineaceae bacterium]